MGISVFYSWQSELPNSVNRYFIRKALEGAVASIKRDYNLDERPEVDHDTKNMPGLPDIVHTIFSKIEASSAFVADVSFTSKSDEGRLCANANVLIELGFALHSLGDERLILVMNDAFGSPKDHLPFNLAARRWPITFTLDPGADEKTRQKVRKDLVSKITEALRVMGDSGILFSTPATSSSVRSDRLLFAQLLEQFPPNGDMAYFLNKKNVGNPIDNTLLRKFNNFTEKWDDALHEFIDPTLEGKRLALMQKLDLFLQELSANVWTVNDRQMSMHLRELDQEHPRRKKRDELDALAIEIYQMYQELIRVCKVKLGFPEAS